jgi:hypothetical protein
MMEQIHSLLYAIIQLHITSDTSGELSPNMLNELGKFTKYVASDKIQQLCRCGYGRTLHKINNFVEAQQDKGRIKRFFLQGEMTAFLKGCRLELEQALDTFKVIFPLLLPWTLQNIRADSRDKSFKRFGRHATICTRRASGSLGLDFGSFRWNIL